MTADQPWMIYGATGYTGRLLAREAHARGLRPTLAGRGETVRELAAELGLPARVFPLDDPARVRAALADIRVVLHAAGPFSATQAPMLDACLATATHYLDITGEIAAFEHLFARGHDARRAGITAVSGVGF
ncbi:saccharopine dehydrogenase NADP-binding domain-containing protein, partial [Deinococcus pimensis]|uniref:saccharopine dehydrogenase NADP-binding domain-containing protein n=1 Tax=Deinococcus pimensis TaxID=309888 RepID=UPI000480405B